MPRKSHGRLSVWSAFSCLIVLLATPVSAEQAAQALRGIGFDERLSEPPILAGALRSTKALAGMPLNVRIVVDRGDLERSPGINDFAALDARLAQYRDFEGIQLYLDLRDVPRTVEALTDWGSFVRVVAARYRGSVSGYVFGIRAANAVRPSAREDGFFVKTTSVNIRAGDAQATTIVGGISDAAWLQSLYAEDIAPYVDAVGLDAGTTSPAILATVDKNDASSANAVKLSYASSPPWIAPVRRDISLQFVPNWKAMTIPETTPSPQLPE